ncbi:MAG: DNA mismatch repair protein MutL, partial [Verrucomicrobiales bacterium]|nr:DNA mismatch repair protein MutL [Verrucomicrobiales bacterium]
PARRKFLRSDDTERAHIQHWLTTAALSHPHVGFTLSLESRTVWQLPPLPAADTPAAQLHTLKERLRLLVGDGLALVPIDASGRLEAVRVAPEDPGATAEVSPPAEARLWGWIGAPGVSRGNRDEQHLFVNRRPIENRGLNAALVEGYHNALMKGRYPVCCLFLEIDPSEVDVNIHPAKREVKFHRERAVRRFVAESIVEALKAWHRPEDSPAAHFAATSLPQRPLPDVSPGSPSSATSLLSTGPTHRQPEFLHPDPVRPSAPPPPAAAHPETPASPTLPPPEARPFVTEPASPPQATPSVPAPTQARTPVAPTIPGPVPLLSIPLRVVGVVGKLYVVLESDRGLVLLDQHAAHERVLYEEMLRRVQEAGNAPSQRLLLPETLELSPKDAAFLRENLDALARLGVGLSEFGERTFLLDALPPFVKSTDPRRFATELVDELRAAGASINVWRLGESVVAKTVCRHAVKANDPLGPRELDSLVENLRGCEMPYTCPHGRPTMIEMNFRDLEKRFGRVTP